LAGTLPHLNGSDPLVCPKCGGETLRVGECFTCAAPRPSGGTGGPRFPIDTFPKPMRRLAEAWAADFPCPVEWIALPMLVVAASAIGHSRVVRISSSHTQGARLWGAVIAEPGSGKSPALRMALAPVRRRTGRLMATYQETLEQWEREGSKGREPREPELWTTDVTIEAMKQSLPRTPRGLLCSQDELSGWVSGMNQYKTRGGADVQKWLELWAGEPFLVKRVKQSRSIYAANPVVNLIGGIVTRNVPMVVNDADDGFSDRFLFAHAEGGPFRRSGPGVPARVVDGWCDLYEELSTLEPAFPDHQPLPVEMELKGDIVAWEAAHMAEADPDGPYEFHRGAWAKLRVYCARLALVVACANGHQAVERADLDAAIELVGYFKAQLLALKEQNRAIFRSDQRTELLSFDPLVKYLRRKGPRTVRDLVMARVPFCRTAGVTQRILDEAKNAGVVVQTGSEWMAK